MNIRMNPVNKRSPPSSSESDPVWKYIPTLWQHITISCTIANVSRSHLFIKYCVAGYLSESVAAVAGRLAAGG